MKASCNAKMQPRGERRPGSDLVGGGSLLAWQLPMTWARIPTTVLLVFHSTSTRLRSSSQRAVLSGRPELLKRLSLFLAHVALWRYRAPPDQLDVARAARGIRSDLARASAAPSSST